MLRFAEWEDEAVDVPLPTHPAGSSISLPSTAISRSVDDPYDPEAIAFVTSRSRKDAQTGCLIWGGTRGRGGYGYASYNRVRYLAHRLSYYGAHGPIPAGLHVCHHCDNPSCVASEHLFLGTAQDNMNDMRRKRRGRWHTLLNEAMVADIRRRLADGWSVGRISRETSIKYGTIFAIKQGRTWPHVEAAPAAGP